MDRLMLQDNAHALLVAAGIGGLAGYFGGPLVGLAVAAIYLADLFFVVSWEAWHQMRHTGQCWPMGRLVWWRMRVLFAPWKFYRCQCGCLRHASDPCIACHEAA